MRVAPRRVHGDQGVFVAARRPRLTIATGTPCRDACRTNRYPDSTVSDDPRTSSAPRLGERVAVPDPGGRHVLPEEDHVGLEHPAAPLARDDPERRDIGVGEHGVAVGVDRVRPRREAGVRGVQPRVQPGARRPLPAGQAHDPVQRPVQLDHAARGRPLQPVDVLGDDPRDQAAPLQLRHRPVPRVRARRRDVPPAEMAARPVPAPRRLAPGERLVGYRLRAPSAPVSPR